MNAGGDMELTAVGHAVLDWIANHSPDESMREQLRHVEAMDREFTGVGSFTGLRVRTDAPRVGFRVAPACPLIQSPQLEHGGGSVLFFEDGHAVMLELYAYGDSFAEDISEWRLVSDMWPNG